MKQEALVDACLFQPSQQVDKVPKQPKALQLRIRSVGCRTAQLFVPARSAAPSLHPNAPLYPFSCFRCPASTARPRGLYRALRNLCHVHVTVKTTTATVLVMFGFVLINAGTATTRVGA